MNDQIVFTAEDLQDPDVWDDTELIAAYNDAVKQAMGAAEQVGKKKGKGKEAKNKQKQKNLPRQKKDKRRKADPEQPPPVTVPEVIIQNEQQRRVPQETPLQHYSYEQYTLPPVYMPQPQPSVFAAPQHHTSYPSAHIQIPIPPSMASDPQMVHLIQSWYSAGYESGIEAGRSLRGR